MLLDHNGRIVAVHLAANTNAWAPSMMMAIIRARFTPARLNGIAIPCLIIMGANTDLDAAQ
jgi:hypothetical protein